MRKFPIVLLSILLTGCATTPDPDQVRSVEGHSKQLIAKTDYSPILKSIATIAIVAVIANELGDQQHKSKCNNRSGLYTVDGKLYTC